jgi:hypothetical protein
MGLCRRTGGRLRPATVVIANRAAHSMETPRRRHRAAEEKTDAVTPPVSRGLSGMDPSRKQDRLLNFIGIRIARDGRRAPA